jgi:hypothetical protein
MRTRTITFRQVFITLCILMFANLCVNLFQGATPPEHDGTCVCDGLDPNCTYLEKYDQDVEYYMRDFQIEITANGDYIIYDGETPLGVVTRDGKCTFKDIMVKYMSDND